MISPHHHPNLPPKRATGSHHAFGSTISLSEAHVSNFLLKQASSVALWLKLAKENGSPKHDRGGSINGKMAERVGFEPTVAFATLDFESSALDRAQPSLRERQTSRANTTVKKLVG